MSVKEVLQSLVDDGMVDCERIGTSNYYWAFPSKALHARKRRLEILESQVRYHKLKRIDLLCNTFLSLNPFFHLVVSLKFFTCIFGSKFQVSYS
jgi:hypothetical protein